MNQTPPSVLVFAGSDPSGGAGIQADIESLAANGCHALPVITGVTAQDTRNVSAVYPLPPAWVKAQAEAILADITPAACKIGLLGSAEIACAVAEILHNRPELPLILDPVLAAGGGAELANAKLRRALLEHLLPRTFILTPNSVEARILGDHQDLARAVPKLLQRGCRYVLLTGTHEDSPDVINTLYDHTGIIDRRAWPRLPATYHGSGCTLASALAAHVALGENPAVAAGNAQRYAWNALKRGFSAGYGQLLPRRILPEKTVLNLQ